LGAGHHQANHQHLSLATPLVKLSIFRGVEVTISHPLLCRPIDSFKVMLVEPPRESNPRLDADSMLITGP